MKTLEEIYNIYTTLHINETLDYNRYNELMLIHSSSSMEGSTLTLDETELLINEGITPKGKPLAHSMMIQDHFKALRLISEIASSSTLDITPLLLKEIGSKVMYSTGGEYNSVLGNIDSRKGDFRVSASRATGGSYYVHHSKINSMINDLCRNLNESLNNAVKLNDVLTLSSYAHLQLLTIHPFADGNGRSARLLQNLIMLHKGMPMVIQRHESKGDYIHAIKKSRDKGIIEPFVSYITEEMKHHLVIEIKKYEDMKNSDSKGMTFMINL